MFFFDLARLVVVLVVLEEAQNSVMSVLANLGLWRHVIEILLPGCIRRSQKSSAVSDCYWPIAYTELGCSTVMIISYICCLFPTGMDIATTVYCQQAVSGYWEL